MKMPFRMMVLILAVASAVPVHAQRSTWVAFRDKGGDAVSRLSGGNAAAFGLSAEALQRRARALGYGVVPGSTADGILLSCRGQALEKSANPHAPIVEEEDLPVRQAYIDAVAATGARIRAVSKWLNAVSVTADTVQLAKILALPFVRGTAHVRAWKRIDEADRSVAKSVRTAAASYTLDYGPSIWQTDMINVPKVHDVWIDGTGILVGMLDDGYHWRSLASLHGAKVLGEYDFIQKDTVTQNQDGDAYDQDSHGTLTFSTLAGFAPGHLIGPAFNASFYLAKTEVAPTEMPIEEDYWQQGIEWLEGKGVAIVSSSLGYSIFDDSTGYRYDHGDFNGRTAVTTRAAARAARLGVVVNTAMGNEGNFPGTLIAPADADSVLSIGAVTMAGNVASFSSNGPTNDGRIKPDVVAPGAGVWCAAKEQDTLYITASGTSLATPLAAGVSALVRSARPDLTVLDVREAMRATADNAGTPNSSRGWGLIDAWKALLYHGMVMSTNPKVRWDGTQSIVYTYVLSPRIIDPATVRMTYAVDGGSGDQNLPMSLLRPYPGLPSGSGLYTASLSGIAAGARVRYQVSASDAAEQRTSPFGAPASRFAFTVGESNMFGADDLVPTTFSLGASYPNPFDPAVHSYATIPYTVPDNAGRVTLELYDVYGRRIATLADGTPPPGAQRARLDADVLRTGMLSSGPYFYSLRAGGTFIVRRMMVLR